MLREFYLKARRADLTPYVQPVLTCMVTLFSVYACYCVASPTAAPELPKQFILACWFFVLCFYCVVMNLRPRG